MECSPQDFAYVIPSIPFTSAFSTFTLQKGEQSPSSRSLSWPLLPASLPVCLHGAWHACVPVCLPARLPLRAGTMPCCVLGAWHIPWHRIEFKIFGINKGRHHRDSQLVDSSLFGSRRMDPDMDEGHERYNTGAIPCDVLSERLHWRQALLWLARPAKPGRSQGVGNRPKRGDKRLWLWWVWVEVMVS